MREKTTSCLKGEKMSNILDRKLPSLFQIGAKWYFKERKESGERVTVSTGESEKKKAEEWEKRYFREKEEKEEESGKPKNLAALLRLFSSADRNPKLKEAELTGGHYTKRYAEFEAIRAGHLLDILPSAMLLEKLNGLTRADVETARKRIAKEYGTRPVSGDTFKTFKAVLNWAYQKGYMREAIAFRVGGIRTEKQKEVDYLPFEDCLKIARAECAFRTEKEREVFICLLLTGMRRAELAAVQGKQLRKARIGEREFYVLDISQSWKDTQYKEMGLPKWGVQRVIPLCKEVGEILAKRKKGDEDFILPVSNSVWTDMFEYIRVHAPLPYSLALSSLTPHKLRHALNTMLIEEDVNPLLTQEYLAWYHQDRNKVQSGYTHIYVKSLLAVVDKIEEKSKEESVEDGEVFVWLD